MNIEELKNEKELLELKIKKLINKYNHKVDLSISDVKINMIRFENPNGIKPIYHVDDVLMTVDVWK